MPSRVRERANSIINVTTEGPEYTNILSGCGVKGATGASRRESWQGAQKVECVHRGR